MDAIEVRAGNVVYLLDKHGNPLTYRDETPIRYQVTAVYRDFLRVGLVTYYGEYVGTHPLESIVYVDEGPIFKKTDYTIGASVVWIDHEDIYEGVIESLGESTAKMKYVKKLMPINHTVRVPYWKIPDGRKSEISILATTTADDDLD